MVYSRYAGIGKRRGSYRRRRVKRPRTFGRFAIRSSGGGRRRSGGRTAHSSGYSDAMFYPLRAIRRGLPRQLGTLVPPKMRQSMRVTYCIPNTEAVSTATNVTTFKFIANTCYDVNSAGGPAAHSLRQPRGFDQMMALYDKGAVSSSKVTIHGTTSQGAPITMLAVFPSADGENVPASVPAIIDHPGSVYTTLTDDPLYGTISAYASTKAMEGGFDPDDSSFQFTASANPTHVWYWYITVCDHNDLVGGGKCALTVTFDQYTIFSEPKVLAGSSV